MSLEERLDADLKDAIRRGQETRKLAIRSAKTAIMMAKVAGQEARTLTDDEVLAIIGRQVKQRRDSIAEFAKGGRQDLIDQEQAEIDVLAVYLPAQMDEAAVRAGPGRYRGAGCDRPQRCWAGDEAHDRRIARPGGRAGH